MESFDIAINFLPLLHFGGTCTYAQLLLDEFIALKPAEVKPYFFIFPEKFMDIVPRHLHYQSVFLPVKNRVHRILCEQYLIPQLVRQRNIACLHQLSFSMPFFHGGFKTITTIHDLTFCKYPETISPLKRLYFQKCFSRSIRESDYLVTDTQVVKDEICPHFQISEKKIEVIPLGPRKNEELSFENTDQWFELTGLADKKFILMVGTLEPRKNYMQAIEWFDKWLRQFPDNDLKLVIAGHCGWKAREVLDKLNKMNNVQWAGAVTDDELHRLYLHSLAYMNLSIYEGFGLPVTEAAGYHLPLILSDIGAFKELTAGALPLIHDYESFAARMNEIVSGQNLRTSVSAAVKEQYQFSASFDKLLQWYAKCL